MFKVMAFLTKREDLETKAFLDYYENTHVPLIRSLAPLPIGYKRSYLVREDELSARDSDGRIPFDVVTELVFPDRATFLAWGEAIGRAGDVVADDEARFLDRPLMRSFVVEEHVTA